MKHFCPKCKTIVSAIAGNQLVIINGKAVIVAGDKTTCGATFISSQHLTVKASGIGFHSANSFSPINNSLSNFKNSFPEEHEKYENYYIERHNTDVFISHKAVIPPFDEGVQILAGAVSYFLNYVVRGKNLFISVSINAFPLTETGKVIPYGSVKVTRAGDIHNKSKLKVGEGIWDTNKKRMPLGSCNITLPEPNLQLVEVELELGYNVIPNNTRNVISLLPPYKKYMFKLNSAARRT